MSRVIKHFQIELEFKSGRHAQGISRSKPREEETFFRMFAGENNEQEMLVAMPNVESIKSTPVYQE